MQRGFAKNADKVRQSKGTIPLRLNELSDDDLLKRLRLLTGDLAEIDDFATVMGDPFMTYNRHGLLIESFAKFGQKLWRAVEVEFEEQERRRKRWKHRQKQDQK